MRKFVEKLLAGVARLVIKRFRPRVVGITGSIGKTSAKEAIALVLKDHFRLRASSGNFNNELGLPLTILGQEAAGRSLAGWLKVLIKGYALAFFGRHYPEVLVLEMGIDRPGDMDYLLKIVRPTVGVLTGVGDSHLEFFEGRAALFREKTKLLRALPKDGVAIINTDDKKLAKLKDKLRVPVITYGHEEGAMLHASHTEASRQGLTFKVDYHGHVLPVVMNRVLAQPQSDSGLAALAVALAFKLDLLQAAKNLKKYEAPRGRLNCLDGVNHSTILDDTYNSAPDSARAALKTLEFVALGERKIVVLGDMRELGVAAREGHLAVGRQAAVVADLLITVGKQATLIAQGAREAGLATGKIYAFKDLATPGDGNVPLPKFLRSIIKPDDVILVKASQALRLEKLVRDIMAEPEKAPDLLVRQNEQWLKK